MATFVSVDLDDIDCYHHIHGLPAPTRRGLALRVWLPRFVELFERANCRATFFVIGRDLDMDRDIDLGEGAPSDSQGDSKMPPGSQQLMRALGAGHELANHSYAHAYDLVDWSAQQIARDLGRCDALLRGLGATPIGFRAPGYTHNRKLLAQVAALGYRYDSSSLPSPLYYAAKRSVMAVMALKGKESMSYAGGGSSFFGETAPHFLSELGLWEVPMSVSRLGRVPLIGSFLLGGAPRHLGPWLMREAKARPDLVLELHAIDLADPRADGIDERIVAKHGELRVPLAQRMEALESLLAARGPADSIGQGLPMLR